MPHCKFDSAFGINFLRFVKCVTIGSVVGLTNKVVICEMNRIKLIGTDKNGIRIILIVPCNSYSTTLLLYQLMFVYDEYV